MKDLLHPHKLWVMNLTVIYIFGFIIPFLFSCLYLNSEKYWIFHIAGWNWLMIGNMIFISQQIVEKLISWRITIWLANLTPIKKILIKEFLFDGEYATKLKHSSSVIMDHTLPYYSITKIAVEIDDTGMPGMQISCWRFDKELEFSCLVSYKEIKLISANEIQFSSDDDSFGKMKFVRGDMSYFTGEISIKGVNYHFTSRKIADPKYTKMLKVANDKIKAFKEVIVAHCF